MSRTPARRRDTAELSGLGYRHQRVQRLRRLVERRRTREAERAFVLEGAKLLAEALRAGAPIEAVFVAPGPPPPVVVEAADRGVRVFELADGVLERVSGTVTPQPVVAIAPWVDVGLDRLEGASLVVVCVDVRDPGNLGTVLRSAEAAGVGGIVCCDGSADVFNPKTVRASAGSLFHVPVVSGGDAVEVLRQMGEWGLRRRAAVAHGGVAYDRVDLTGRTALVLGNEAHGVPEEVTGVVDEAVTIPIAGRGESLNVGMAAAVLCFEAARQRRLAGGGE